MTEIFFGKLNVQVFTELTVTVKLLFANTLEADALFFMFSVLKLRSLNTKA